MAISTVKAIINGITHDLSLNSENGYYEADITAPTETSYNNNSGHYYPITIKATDSAGNVTQITDTDATFGDILKLRVKETISPVITITSPTEGEVTSNTSPFVEWTVTDSGSGVVSDSISINVDDTGETTNGILKTEITNGYQCLYYITQILSEGNHTVTVGAIDNDGNKATERTVNFYVDATPPELSVDSPTNNLVTNEQVITVAGITQDITSGIEKVTVKINAGTEQEVDVDSNGNFSANVTLTEGANTIAIKSYDTGGLSSSVTRIVTLDVEAPVIEEISITPNPVSTGELLELSVKVTD